MKKFFFTSLALLTIGTSAAQKNAGNAEMLFTTPGGDKFSGYMVAADKTAFLWIENERSTARRRQSLSTATVYFHEPPEFTEAMILYKSRNYKDAAPLFASCSNLYSKVKEVPGNYSTLAAFYEMECARRLEEFDKLVELEKKFIPDPLIHDFHKVQIEINKIFWEAVRTQSWARLNSLVNDEEWLERRLPGNLRAQLSYCEGLSLEGIKEPIRALTSYNHAFISDFGASEEITTKSALNCFRIILNDPDVKTVMDLYDTPDYNDNLNGALLIKEANALISLWDKTLGAGSPLPAEYKVFAKYPAKDATQ